jgi:4-amino-4-deoxy-L-arabinose transferase-like glycosyltransferase
LSKKIGGKLFSFFALLLAAFSPWHLLFSRMALEASTLPSLFIILTLYLWVSAKEKKYTLLYIILLGLTVGFGVNTYQSSKLIFPLVAIIIFIDILKYSEQRIKKAGLFALIFFIGILPQLIMAFSLPEHYFLRANSTMIPFSFSFDYFNAFLKNYFVNLGPDYLFFSLGEYNNLSMGRLLVVEFPFFYTGLFFFGSVIRKTKAFNPLYLYILLAISIFPSALTGDNPHALRTSCLMILFPLVTASGIMFFLDRIKNVFAQKIYSGIMAMLIVVNSMYFIVKYVNSRDIQEAGQQNFLVLLSEKLNNYKDQYSRIYIEDMGNQPSIYVAGYCNMKPEEFQKAKKEFDPPGEIHLVRLGKYFFLDRDKIEREVKDSSGSCLLILKSSGSTHHLIDSVDNGIQKVFFYDDQHQPFLK